MIKSTAVFCLVFFAACSYSQMGYNNCLFRIYDGSQVLLKANAGDFEISNNHPYLTTVNYKTDFPYSSFPDSCWILHTEDIHEESGRFPNAEHVVFHPDLVIVRKSTNDTMRVSYRYMVYAFKEGTNIPVINGIVFMPGHYNVYRTVTKRDWHRRPFVPLKIRRVIHAPAL